MDLISFSIKRPVTILVGVILVVMFGLLGLDKLPYQLTPSVSQPEVSVTTIWAGATPYEIERDIIEEQEEVLKSVNGLVSYESSSKDNMGTVTLKFKIGTDSDKAILDVSNKLNEVSNYPENVDKPVIEASGESASPVIWTMLQTTEENPKDAYQYKTFFENEIKEHIERVDGVASMMILGGVEDEVHITMDTEKLASYGLTIVDVSNKIASENIDISAGVLDMGRRSYRVRTVGQYRDLKSIESVVLKSDGQRRVLLSDVAKASFASETYREVSLFLGKTGIFAGIKPDPDANIVAMTDSVQEVVDRLNETLLKDNGLKIKWIYDQRPYIVGAIDLVQQNIMIGAVLAIIVLLLFLRSISPTAVVSMAIPISIVATFIVLEAMGRSLNTISLAGISFAVGMLVDSAIVVLENIDRHRKMGKDVFTSAYEGTSEVWGALIASALTTIAVFVPIVFLQDEAGQLFKDIAIAVVSAVTFSLFVSISVIPMLWTTLLKITKKTEAKEHNEDAFLNRVGSKASSFIMIFVGASLKNKFTKFLTILTLTAFSIASVWLFFPKMEYLPQGNKNLIFNILIPPPGFSYEENRVMGEKLMEMTKPYVSLEPKEIDGFPSLSRVFYVARDSFIIFGGTSAYEDRAKELIPLFAPMVNSFPSVFGISVQAGVFEQGIGEGRTVDVDISGQKIEDLANVGGMLFGAISGAIKGAQVRPVPSIELLYPEVRVIPDRDKLTSVGFNTSEFGFMIDVLLDGRKISEFQQDGHKKVDLILKAQSEDIKSPEDLYNSQIALRDSRLIPISSLSDLDRVVGISEIRHLEGKRTITLQVTPPQNITIQEAMEIIQGGILPKLEGQGALKNVSVKLAGTADKLVETVKMLSYNFILAVIITYLLMASLFGNFLYPFVILFTVPLAMAGGFIGLEITNRFIAPQPLDILTMLGFIILIGIVVNNAILIVHQALNLIRKEGVEHKKAILESTKTRLRPIYMSSLTSIFGMLPLILAPGPGSEFYRGLGSVITGGLAFSTIFTIFMTPALLMFVIRMEKRSVIK